MSCKKISFASHLEAIEYKKFANRRAKERYKGLPKTLRNFKKLTHTYLCDKCETYHLTTMTNTGIRRMKERKLYRLSVE